MKQMSLKGRLSTAFSLCLLANAISLMYFLSTETCGKVIAQCQTQTPQLVGGKYSLRLKVLRS